MFGGGRYFGLRGRRLNYAIGLIAGVDFLYVVSFNLCISFYSSKRLK